MMPGWGFLWREPSLVPPRLSGGAELIFSGHWLLRYSGRMGSGSHLKRAAAAPSQVLVLPTDEELSIAHQTLEVVQRSGRAAAPTA